MEAARLPLVRNGSTIAYALVDPSDLEWLSQWTWTLHATSKVACRRETYAPYKRRWVWLHRQIMEVPRGARTESGERLEVDHINRDRLDNRRSNLRVVTGAQNSQNVPARGGSSNYRGVSWCKNRKQWLAVVYHGRLHRLGYFDDEEEAARVASAFRAEHMPFSADAAEARERELVSV